MDLPELVQKLEETAARVGVLVRYERFERATVQPSSGGGLCKVKGKLVILVDESLGPAAKVAILAAALARFDLEGIYLAPQLRATIHRHGKKAHPELRPLARTTSKRTRS